MPSYRVFWRHCTLRQFEDFCAPRIVLFFFSSSRRHARCSRDWSSDVCSSDLPYTDAPPKTARELDRGVLANILGGAFRPGGEVGWIMRNPAIWRVPYRLKADPDFYNFGQTAAMASSWSGNIPEVDYST